jgi:hypothetical protein
MPLKFPSNHDRLAVIGRTGSGKTQAAAWHLSGKNFDRQPWVIVNTKGDPLLNEIGRIRGVHNIGIGDTPGDKGLYIVSPLPNERDQLDAFFFRIWEKQNTGVYIDEGYMIEKTDGLNALLTQGRSRDIPMIVLSQRPAWISKFVFSEADYIQLFHLQHEDDRKNVGRFVPFNTKYRLRKFHSYWYNVGENEIVEFSPVPPREAILESFRDQFPPDDVAEQDIKVSGPIPEIEPARRRVV